MLILCCRNFDGDPSVGSMIRPMSGLVHMYGRSYKTCSVCGQKRAYGAAAARLAVITLVFGISLATPIQGHAAKVIVQANTTAAQKPAAPKQLSQSRESEAIERLIHEIESQQRQSAQDRETQLQYRLCVRPPPRALLNLI
jgi:hypothetical protein